MNVKTEIYLDKHIIGFLLRIINAFVIALGKILRIDHRLDKPFKKIAVCKYKGMGSIIQATPLLQTLKKNYPGAEILFISAKANSGLLKQIDCIDRTICIDDRSFLRIIVSIVPFIWRLIKEKIEVYIDLEVYSNFSTLISLASLSKNRLGFYINPKHYRLGNYTHMMFYNTHSMISQTYLQFARLLTCDPVIDELIALNPAEKIYNLNEQELNLEKEKYFIINPNASDLRIERRWPALFFVELLGRISKKYPDYKIFLIGSEGEKKYVNGIVEKTGHNPNVYSLAGKTSIKTLIALIKHAALVISNDSGPMHIAFSVRTKTVALFGPCSPNQYGAHKNSIPVYANLYCSPCIHEFISPPCKGNNYCMYAISVDTVFDKVVYAMAQDFISEKPGSADIQYTIMLNKEQVTIGTITRGKRREEGFN